MCHIYVDDQQRRVHWHSEVSEDGVKTGGGMAATVRAQGTDAGIQENETTTQITGECMLRMDGGD